MSSIRININSRAMIKQTSTTFTETFARFFLHAWYLEKNIGDNYIDSWLIVNESSKDHKSRKSVSKSFQTATNEMISEYDGVHGCDNNSLGRWTRDKIERQLLVIISRTNNNNNQYPI